MGGAGVVGKGMKGGGGKVEVREVAAKTKKRKSSEDGVPAVKKALEDGVPAVKKALAGLARKRAKA